MIKRTKYIDEIRDFFDSDLIKIITGIRRSGKSIILNQIMEELKNNGKEVLFLNFEDERVLMRTPDHKSLIDYIESIKTDRKIYLFFDEIQEVEGWERACKTLRLGNYSLFITGSNSKLLSKEYTRHFSGRYISLRVRPFVYLELLEYAKELKLDVSISNYLIWGGFPKRLEFFKNQLSTEKYLIELNNTIIENDLIIRYSIKNVSLFRRVISFVLKNNSRIISARSIESYLKSEHISGSINTIINYLQYLEDAFIIERIKPFSTRAKTELNYYYKIYDADVSLNSIRVIDNKFDITHNLENIIYNELLFRGYKLKVFNDDEKEVDFVAVKDGTEYYIQVSYSVADEKTYEREMGAFEKIKTSANKILITNDDFNYSITDVRHINLATFLTSKDALIE